MGGVERTSNVSLPSVSRDDWYRLTKWNPEHEANFRARLKRSRTAYHKAQYLRIQASTLLEAGLASAALSLLDEISEKSAEECEASVPLCRAQALWVLGDKPRSFESYMEALDAQRRSPTRYRVALSFAEHFHDYEDGAHRCKLISLLDEELEHGRGASMFPHLQYRYAVVSARLTEGLGQLEMAAAFARAALDASDRKHSGFANHPELGLVDSKNDLITFWLRKLATTQAGNARRR